MPYWDNARLQALASLCYAQEQIFQNLPTITRDLGFEWWHFMVAQPHGNRKPLFLSTNVPRVHIEHYVQQRLYTQDPRLNHGLHSIAPLYWQPSLFTDSPQLWQSMRDTGMTQGMTQGCHHRSGLIAILCLERSRTLLPREEFEQKADTVLSLTHQLTLASIERITRDDPCVVARGGSQKPLTDRETETLRQSAIGHTAAQIGTDMCVSERTVQFHISSAITKLGVPNKTAAVARALMLGLFELPQAAQ